MKILIVLILLFIIGCQEKKPVNITPTTQTTNTDSLLHFKKIKVLSFRQRHGIGVISFTGKINTLDSIQIDNKWHNLRFNKSDRWEIFLNIKATPRMYYNEESYFELEFNVVEKKGDYYEVEIGDNKTALVSSKNYKFFTWKQWFQNCSSLTFKDNYWSDTLKTKPIVIDPTGDITYTTKKIQGHWIFLIETEFGSDTVLGPSGWVQWRDDYQILIECNTTLLL